MDEIWEVTIHYISGRDEKLNKEKALEVLASKRSDWMKDRVGLHLLFSSNEDPFLKIYRCGKAYIFEHSQGVTEFESMDKLREDKYFETLFDTFVK